MPDLFSQLDRPAAPPVDHCTGCGRAHDGAREVTLADGSTASSYSETWRLECEARGILRLPKLTDRHGRLDRIHKFRGARAADDLRDRMLIIWNARQAEKLRA